MASIGRGLRFLKLKPSFLGLKDNTAAHKLIRNAVMNTKGAVLPAPTRMRFGFPLVCIVVAPFMYVGATISKEGAAFLEENDIFVPEDDD